MKHVLLTFAAVSAMGLLACGQGTSDELLPGGGTYSNNPNYTAGGSEESTFNHTNDPGGVADGPLPDPGQRALETAAAGGAVASARMHSCGKLSLRGMRSLMATRGTSAQTQGLVTNAANAAALGGPNYTGRIPEAPFASTSALSKAFDIYVSASTDITNANWNPTACPGVKLVDGGKFTKDGVSCLIGKPARPEHMALADDLVAQAATPAEGQRIAVSALLAAAHTCE
ncbi:MAG: hypothetical protein U0183_15240 [Polyangiaceae bacterium]|jgi:hypothetical protein